MEVERTVTLERADLRIVLLKPDFPLPENWPPQGGHHENILVSRPDGSEIEVVAQFNMSHVNIRGPEVDLQKSWRLTVMLKDCTSEDVPVGSKLLAARETAKIVLDAVALELGD